MPLIMPPDVPAIIEPASAPLIVCNSAAIEFRREAVWVHMLTRHCLGGGQKEFRREAVLCWTVNDYLKTRGWVSGLIEPAPEASNVVNFHH